MKFLRASPPVPPYLHLGSAWLKVPVKIAREASVRREIDDKWRELSANVVQSRQHVNEITRRIDERQADPDYTEAPYEVFYTVSDDGRGYAQIDYYF